MRLRGKKLGILISAAAANPSFHHGVRLAAAALAEGVGVYLYCIDDAVTGLEDANLQALKQNGAHLFACAYAARERNLPTSDLATFSGLAVVSDLIASTDRFLSFN